MAKAKTITILAIMVGCSGLPDKKETRQLGGPGGSDTKVAHAAPGIGGSGGTALQQPKMPDNPAHYSFRIPRVAEVQMSFLSVHQYPHKITHEGDWTIVTVFIPRGQEISITLTEVGEGGKPIGEPQMYTLSPAGKLGTYTIQPGETGKELKFDSSLEQTLKLGENTLEVLSSKQFIGGSLRTVVQGVFTAKCDGVYHVSWMGCKELRSFQDGPALPHLESFELELKAGEELLLCPVTPSGEPVSVSVEAHEE